MYLHLASSKHNILFSTTAEEFVVYIYDKSRSKSWSLGCAAFVGVGMPVLGVWSYFDLCCSGLPMRLVICSCFGNLVFRCCGNSLSTCLNCSVWWPWLQHHNVFSSVISTSMWHLRQSKHICYCGLQLLQLFGFEKVWVVGMSEMQGCGSRSEAFWMRVLFISYIKAGIDSLGE